jgi:hypothetical protein
MQRKPIANKYRKGTMKSTLYSTCYYLRYHALLRQCLHTQSQCTSSTGSERESEIALQRLYFTTHMPYIVHTHTYLRIVYMIYARMNSLKHYSAKYNRTECLCASFTLAVAGCYVFVASHITRFAILHISSLQIRAILQAVMV